MEITFKNINIIVQEVLKLDNSLIKPIEKVGLVYYNFLQSGEEEIKIRIPQFSDELLLSFNEYLIHFHLTYNILNQEDIKLNSEHAIFDIFNYHSTYEESNNVKSLNYSKKFKEKVNDVLIFEDDIVVDKNRFIPVFYKNQLDDLSSKERDTIYKSFKVFSFIERNNIIKKPILIDLHDNILLSIINRNHDISNIAISQSVSQDKTFNDSLLDSYADKYDHYNISQQVFYQYPYHVRIDSRLEMDSEKFISLQFTNRLRYSDVEDNDLIIAPSELLYDKAITIDNVSDKYNIIKTNHSFVLFELIRGFSEEWKSYSFNVYTTPNPKYWFMCVNKGKSLDEWKDQFKQDYPLVSEKPIIETINKIIFELHELDWILSFNNYDEKINILMPKTGNSNKTLSQVFTYFKEYISQVVNEVEIISFRDTYDYTDVENLVILDSFSKINLSNILQRKELQCEIVVPDFLYYNYNPWIIFSIYKYQTEFLLNIFRESIDENFENNKEDIEPTMKLILNNIRKELKGYYKNYKVSTPIAEVVSEEITKSEDDYILLNEENIEDTYKNETIKGKKRNLSEYSLLLDGEKAIYVKENVKVLVRKSTLYTANVGSLAKGNQIIFQNDLNKIVNDNDLVSKLNKMPDVVKNYQHRLYVINQSINLFKVLQSKGFSISTKYYFQSSYLQSDTNVDNDSLTLPRKKLDWNIICEYLSVSESDKILAWIQYYGRKHTNKIKRVYRIILDKLVENNQLGELENIETVDSVVQIIIQNLELFNTSDEVMDPVDIARSIITSIGNELEFTAVKEIKELSNEHV